MDAPAYCHIVFRPNIKLISTVRRFVNDFYMRLLVGQEMSSRLALATHELLENAVAYASDGETEVRIEVVGNSLQVRTWNRASPEDIEAVKGIVDEMNRTMDADEYYQSRLVKTAKRTDGSGLGLARIRAEAEMKVSCEVDKDRVCILATMDMKPEQMQMEGSR